MPATDYVGALVDHLNASGLGCRAYRSVPSSRPERFMVVTLTGGPVENAVQRSPSMDVDCWATDARGSADLADAVANAVISMPDEIENVFGSRVTTTYYDPDLDSGTPRTVVSVGLWTNR